MTLYFVRHGPVVVERTTPPSEWILDSTSVPLMTEWAPRLPQHASSLWVSSDETKAVTTARHLTRRPLAVDPGLGEVTRGGWSPSYDDTVAEFFAHPLQSPTPQWESAHAATQRFAAAVRRHASTKSQDVVIVTHGLVLTLLRWHACGAELDTALWKDLRFPDILEMSEPDRRAWISDTSYRCSLVRPTWL